MITPTGTLTTKQSLIKENLNNIAKIRMAKYEEKRGDFNEILFRSNKKDL